MKKTLTIIMVMLLCTSMLVMTSCGKKDDGIKVNVVISSEGEIVLNGSVSAKDADGDGVVSVSDAIFCAHEENFKGGAAAGYVAENTEFGISIFNLWGVENGGSYGFYLNNAYTDSLAAEIKEGDLVSAYSYADLTAWTDVFSFFDKYELESTGEVALTLTYIGFDENWMPVNLPAPDCVITVNGEATEYVTDENGKVTFTLEKGEYEISASSETLTLVPPVCTVTVK